MKDYDWNKIKEKLDSLEDDLEPDELVSRLYQSCVLSDDDKERIMCEKTRLDKVKRLLGMLRTKELPQGDVYSVFYGHLKETQEHLAHELRPPGRACKPPVGISESARGRNIDQMQSLDTEGLCRFLEPILKKNNISDIEEVLQSFRDEKITGRVFLHTSLAELKEICPHLKFGDRKNIVLERDEFIQQNQSQFATAEIFLQSKSGLQNREYARRFDTNCGYTEKYQKGKVLQHVQTSTGNLIDPIHLYIPLDGDIDADSALETIGWETVKFSASCMNDRTNGTIHFGVHDGNDGIHVHGEVVGLTNLEKRECEMAISSWVEKSFPPDKCDASKLCIHSSKFVDVISNKECTGFVLEVDIEPKAAHVQDDVYYVRDQFTEKGEKEPKEQLFRFQRGIPTKQNVQEIIHFTKTITRLTKQRAETERISTKQSKGGTLLRKLQEFLCDGDTKMGDVYPILVINALDGNVCENDLVSRFSFLLEIDWICVFDFDPTGCSRGIYNFLTKSQDKEFQVKLTDDFDHRANDHPQMHQADDKLHNEMTSSNLIPWVFCNGYEIMDKQELGVMEWKKKRSEGFKEAVRYFAFEIPRERAKIIYLLLSKDYDVMLEAAEELSLKFQNQWIVVAETDSVAAQWQEQMICRKVSDKMSIEKLLVTGNPWENISTCIKEITKSANAEWYQGDCSLITHLGTRIQLPKNNQNRLCDLEVLSSDECEKLEAMSNDEKLEIAKEQEKRFYEGHPPSWVNFYHGNHVLRRKNHDELLNSVMMVLKGDVPDNVNIGRVTIYHQPGSGGTTTAKQVLWDMREKFRCCLLTSHSKESHNQIVDLWKYGEEVTQALPVLLMVDNLDEEKLQNLTENLQAEANKYLQGRPQVMCVLLLCVRQSSLPSEREHVRFVLRQELHPEETNWFQLKYNELAESFKRQKGPNPKHLLSFNIMKENFSERYIEKTVEDILHGIKLPEERYLVKYVSLLNAYDQQFRGIPIPCFDSLMVHIVHKKWELNLSASARMLLTRAKSRIRIINPLLCKRVLHNLIQTVNQGLGEAALEFLHSDCCKLGFKDVAFKGLSDILRDTMKARERDASGKPSTFSRLIQELYDTQYVDTAAEILELMYGKTSDPFIAQQLARLYILCQNWTQATHFANEATNLHPNNSYLWDTHGQIFKIRLSKLFETGISLNLEENKRLFHEAVECAYEGTARFHKVQDLSSGESSLDPNRAGYFGEIEICLYLLDVLSLIPQFKEKTKLLKFLNGASCVPQELAFLTDEQLRWLTGLQGKVLTTLRKLEDEACHYNQEYMGMQNNKSTRFFLKGNLDRISQTLGSYFGDDDIPDLEEARTLSPDKRRRQVRRLGANSLQSILKLTNDDHMKEQIFTIYKLAQLNTEHPQCLPFDCRMTLGSALALLQIAQSPAELPNFEHLLQTCTKLYNMKHERHYIDLEPYLYLLLFHWPTASRKQFQSIASPDILADAVGKWSDAYMQKYPKEKKSNFPVRDRPFFFLTNKVGIESIVHIDQLKEHHCPNRTFGNHQIGKILGTRRNQQLLHRFEGMLSGGGWKVTVHFETPKGNKLGPMCIPLHIREPRQSLVNKKVYFVLGFGWSGPIACDIQIETVKCDRGKHSAVPRQPPVPFPQMRPPELFQNIVHQVLAIDQQLSCINQLKRYPRNQLNPFQVQLLQSETRLINNRRYLLQKRKSTYLENL